MCLSLSSQPERNGTSSLLRWAFCSVLIPVANQEERGGREVVPFASLLPEAIDTWIGSERWRKAQGVLLSLLADRGFQSHSKEGW